MPAPGCDWLIVAALEAELRPVRRRLGNSIHTAALGIGARRAGETMRRLLVERRPGRVLLVGFSGSLSPDLAAGEVVGGQSVVQVDGRTWQLAVPNSQRCGQLLCVDEVASDPAKKSELGRRFNALAVDMESAAVAEVCQNAQIPLTILRAISDGVDDALPPDLACLVHPDGRTNLLGVITYLLRHPNRLPALLGLGRATGLAGERLAEAAWQVVGE